MNLKTFFTHRQIIIVVIAACALILIGISLFPRDSAAQTNCPPLLPVNTAWNLGDTITVYINRPGAERDCRGWCQLSI